MNKPFSCQECPYFEYRFVPSEGDDNADICLIGEAPGATEEQTGRVFAGGAGRILDQLLFSVGIQRNQCKIMNVLKCRPPNNDITANSARKALRLCTGIFIEELNKLNCRVIIPMGNTALNALGYSYKIKDIRGMYLDFKGTPVVPTLHPAALMRQFEDWVVVQSDLRKALAVGKAGKIPQITENFNINPTVLEVEEFCAEICETVSYDIETFETNHDLRTPIKLIGLGKNESEAMCVPFITQSGNLYWKTKDEAARALRAINNVLSNPNILKIGQNLLFDFRISMNHGFEVVGPVYDTMLAHFLIFHPIAHDLQTIASLYTDFPPWKTLKGLSDEDYRKYNCRDCIVLHHMKPKLDKDIDDNGVRWVFDTLMKTLIPYCQMTLNGLPIDEERQQEVAKKLLDDKRALTKKLQHISGALALNPNSTKQLQEVLFKQMKLKSAVKTKGGKALSVAKDVINRLSLRYPENAFLQKLLDYNSLEQLSSTYSNPTRLADGRVHPHFKLAVITGRPSSVNPNVLNLPAKRGDPQGYVKSMYVAPPGRTFIEADWSQAELVVFAEISDDPVWKACFQRGDDVHKLNGIALTGIYEERYRTFYKNFIYGFIYGSEGSAIEKAAPKELIQNISIGTMIKQFQQVHPRMFEYRERLAHDIATEHRIRNPFGRPRFFVGQATAENLREAYNFPIQSTVADMMNEKIGLFARELDLRDRKLLMPLYDATYWEVADEVVKEHVALVRDIMEAPVNAPNGMVFKLRVDVKVGKSFAALKKEEEG